MTILSVHKYPPPETRPKSYCIVPEDSHPVNVINLHPQSNHPQNITVSSAIFKILRAKTDLISSEETTFRFESICRILEAMRKRICCFLKRLKLGALLMGGEVMIFEVCAGERVDLSQRSVPVPKRETLALLFLFRPACCLRGFRYSKHVICKGWRSVPVRWTFSFFAFYHSPSSFQLFISTLLVPLQLSSILSSVLTTLFLPFPFENSFHSRQICACKVGTCI